MREAAAEGTLLHSYCETLLKQFTPDEWDEQSVKIAGADSGLVQEALAQVRPHIDSGELTYSEELTPGTYTVELFLESNLTGRQRVDFAAMSSDEATVVIVDFKFTRNEPDPRLQLGAYALTLAERCPNAQVFVLQAPAPRVLADPYYEVLPRSDLNALQHEITQIIDKASDTFTPGSPGQHCVTCAGNGRCPWQAASLSVINNQTGLVPLTKDQILQPATPLDRGIRRDFITWLDKMISAVKDQDKEWLAEQPDREIPGWKITMVAGRKSISKELRLEAIRLIETELGLTGEDLLSCLQPDVTAITDLVALQRMLSPNDAKSLINVALSPVMVRGDAYPTFRKK